VSEERAAGAGAQSDPSATPDTAAAEAFAPGESPQDGGTVTVEEADSGELEALVEKAAQRDEYLALAQRTQADFENYRKRVARDGALAEGRGLSRLARELLPALDNLDRALGHADEADPALVEGLLLVQRELLGALERVGIESYGAPGEQFDPEVHEAVAQQPFEGRRPGEIVELYQSGYRLAGGVIRPARVLVAG
jgi:molecular chaperone GrpE